MSAPRRKAGATPVRHMFGAIAPEPLPLWLELWNALVPHLEAHAVCAEQTDNAGDKIPLRCIGVGDEIRVRVKVNGRFAHQTRPRFFFPGVTPELRCALAETLYPNGIAWMLPVVAAAEQNRRASTARPEDFWSWWLSELPASELVRQLERAQQMMDVGALSYHPGARGWRPSTTVAPPDGTAAAGRVHEAWRRTAGKQRGSVQAQLWWSGQRTGWRWRVGRGSSTATATRYGFHSTYRVLSDGQAKNRADAVEAADAAIAQWAGVEDDGVKETAKRAAVRMAERAEDVPDAAADVPDGDGNYDCTQCGNTTPRNGWCDRCIAEEEARTS